MTNESRQDTILIALVASLTVHAVLMWVMRPQVMSRLDLTSALEARDARKLVVREAVPPPATVAMKAVPDVAALRSAPVAETVAPWMSALSAPAAETAPVAPTPSAAGTPEMPRPVEDVAPYLSEKIHVDKGPASFTTPVVESAGRLSTSLPAQAPVPAPTPVAPEVEVPMFTAPTLMPHFEETTATAVRPSLPTESRRPADSTATFVPVKDVMQVVDEKVVGQEKAAVRDLLNVRDARELAPVIDVAATSAREGDWLYYRVQINPRQTLPVVPKDVVILLDASGSIGDDRLQSCRKAARRILRSCTNTGDRFNLVAFRDRFSYAFKNWQECTQQSFATADKWLNALVSHGRTDVFASARSVLTLPRDPTRPLIALIVTDGDANVGVSETAQILSRFSALNDGLISVYMYGVKGSANRELIDVLTRGNRGESFIYSGSRWRAGEEIESLSRRFRDPVLSDLRIVYAAGTPAEAYPQLLRNLYRGEIVDFVGRIPASAGVHQVAFSIKGLNGAKAYEGFFKVDLAGVGFDAKLPEIWRAEKVVDAKLRAP
ncbi:MAG: VWA domain-containing protein [Kiritimatiellia bacterium]